MRAGPGPLIAAATAVAVFLVMLGEAVLSRVNEAALRRQGAVAQPWPQQDFLPPEPDLEDTLAETPPRLLRNTHYSAVGLFVAITATPFLISRIFLTPGIARALLAS